MNTINHSASTHNIPGLLPGDAGKAAAKTQGAAGHNASLILQDITHDSAAQITAASGRSRVHSSTPMQPAVPMKFELLNTDIAMSSLTSSSSGTSDGAESQLESRESILSTSSTGHSQISGTASEDSAARWEKLPKLQQTYEVQRRIPQIRSADDTTVVQLQKMDSGSSMDTLSDVSGMQLTGRSQTSGTSSDDSATRWEKLPKLQNTYEVHHRTPQIRSADDTTVVQLQKMDSGASMDTLSDVSGMQSSTATQTEETKGSALNRYGPLVASSLSAILGAILVIVAKTHGHDEIDVDEADDLQPQEPNYDAVGQQAAQEAEQAFVDKWHDPDVWGPGKIDGEGRNLETGEENPYFEAVRDQDTGEYAIGDTLSPEGERTLGELRETAATSAIDQARTNYEQALEEAASHNAEHASGTLRDQKNGKDHDAMLGIGATLIGVGGLAATLMTGNKLTHNSHNKQNAQSIPIEHGSMKNFVEQRLFRVQP